MTFRLNLPRFLLACGVGVSVQFVVSGLETLIFGDVIPTASAGGERDVALAEHGGRACEAAKSLAPTVTSDFSSFDWVVNDRLPAECVGVSDVSVAVIDDALPEPIEIADVPPVVTVVATVSGDDARGANEPSIRRSSANQRTHPLGQQLAALDMDSLDEIRGGFEFQGSGLKFSIGIERAVFVNGNLVANTVLVPKDIQRTTGSGSAAASALPATVATGTAGTAVTRVTTGTLGVIQNGSGNNVGTQISPNLAGTVIQNSLNDQRIQNVTTINASVNSTQMYRAMSVHNAIQTGIISTLRR